MSDWCLWLIVDFQQMLGQLSAQGAPPVPSLPASLSRPAASGLDTTWLDSFEDQLTMAIATKSWEDAVSQVEKGELTHDERIGTRC